MNKMTKGMRNSLNRARGEAQNIRDDIKKIGFRESTCYSEYGAMGVRVTNNAVEYERIIKALSQSN